MPDYSLLSQLTPRQNVDYVGSLLQGIGARQEIEAKKQQGELAKLNAQVQQQQLEYLPVQQQMEQEKHKQALAAQAMNMKATQAGLATEELKRKALSQEMQFNQMKMVNNLTSSVLTAPQDQQESAWKSALNTAKLNGIDISSLPQQWNDDAKGMARNAYVQSGTYLKQMELENEKAKLPLVKAIDETGKPIYVRQDKAEGKTVFDPKIAGQAQIKPGNIPLSNATATKLQDEVVGYTTLLNDIGVAAEKFKPEYFGYAAKAKFNSINEAAKLGGDVDTDFVQNRAYFRNEIEQIFNQYRKEITGAAASEKELESLKKSMMNMDQSPEEFMAAFNQFKNKVERARAKKAIILQEGLPTGKNEIKDLKQEEKAATSSAVGQIVIGKDGKQYKKVEGGYVPL
jgi:hypothetical protein